MGSDLRSTSSDISIPLLIEGRPSPLNPAGEYPYTRGIHKDMYRGKLWTMRQYAGFSTARETNKRFHELLSKGAKGLSCAFDLPTQMGLDSDDPKSRGEVGKVGVAIDTIEDMRMLFQGIDLGNVSTSMTINATAAVLLVLYELVAEEQGIPSEKLSGTIQNDVLKEYISRGTYIYPPTESLRIITDIFQYCQKHIPRWNTISISGYHIREAGSTAAQELAFTFANAITYVEQAIKVGLEIDSFAPRLSFFFNVHNNFLEEIAKFRAARRMWAKLMKERFGAKNENSWMLRFHSQVAGSTLTAQQPLNNIARVTVQALAAVLGGTQSLHTNAYDEALQLPTSESAELALRTQQILAHESGVVDFVDPLGGSYAIEYLTDELEKKAQDYLHAIEAQGGVIACINNGYLAGEIMNSAYAAQIKIEEKKSLIVGVNCFEDGARIKVKPNKISPKIESDQVARLARFKKNRDYKKVKLALSILGKKALGPDNIIMSIKDCMRNGCTLGEVSNVLRQSFGEFRPSFKL